jgi:glutamine cyclotransferase
MARQRKASIRKKASPRKKISPRKKTSPRKKPAAWRRIAFISALAAAIAVIGYLSLRHLLRPRFSISPNAPTHTYRVVNAYPHDPGAFTQGLTFHAGFLYEGTGQRGKSSLRQVDLETGKTVKMRMLDDRLFGEGIAVYEDRIIQLTYTSEKGFVYDLANLEPLTEFTYSGQGWGLTHDGTNLIMSDGTSMLQFLDPVTFQRTGQVIVRDGDTPVIGLNELEFIDGEVYANVWQTDFIARISPRTGQVSSWIDMSGLLESVTRKGPTDVLNGIAYDEAGGRLFVTGKLWPHLFEIEIVN